MSAFSPIVHSLDPVTLVGGGQATPEDLHKALRLAPRCVAADGGAALALGAGVALEAVIGDFDSIDEGLLAQVPAQNRHKISEQDSTDFEKALTRISAPVVLGVGCLGGRIDHQLAALHALAAYPAQPCVLIGAHEVLCLAPPDIRLPTQAGDVVSLFPLGLAGGQSEGLTWPIDGLLFRPDTRIGTSNRATGPMRLRMDEPTMILILPRHLLAGLVAGFLTPDAVQWSVRAG